MKKTFVKKIPVYTHSRISGFFDETEEDFEDDIDAGSEEAEWNFFGDESDGEGNKSSMACEDCDYRWEDFYDEIDEIEYDAMPTCPMCGSTRVTQL